MAQPKCFPTRWEGLWYANTGDGKRQAWHFVRAAGRVAIGPPYPSAIDLLAVADNFASANGFTVPVQVRPTVGPQGGTGTPPKPANRTAAEMIRPGCTVESLWAGFWKQIAPDGATDTQRKEMRKAFLGGVWAMLEVMQRAGEDDVTEKAACNWLLALRQETRTASRS